MTDQPKPKKPSAISEAAAPKPAEKKDSAQAGSPSLKSEAASLPVTEKMPPPPPPKDETEVKSDTPTLPHGDTKPLGPPSDSTDPEKAKAVPAESSPAPAAATPADTKSTVGETPVKAVTDTPSEAKAPAGESIPQSVAPSTVVSAVSEPPADTTEHEPSAATPAESKPAASEPSAKPESLPEIKAKPESATEKPASPPTEVDAAKPAVTDKPTVKIPEGSKDDTLPPGSHQRVTQRFSEPGTATAPATGSICPSCGHRNRPGTLVCDNCGTNLIAGVQGPIGTRDLESAQEKARQEQPSLTELQIAAVKSAGSTQFNEDMVLRIEIEGGATPMLVYPKQEIILGRRDPNTGTLPDVDLTAYMGYRMGVSRTHASIRLQDKILNLSDRGSSNGTFLNGNKLTAHHPYPLRDGDEIRLGQMLLKIYFQTNKSRK